MMHSNDRPQSQASSGPVRRPDPAHGSTPPARLEFLDGLRGVTALFVLVHHAIWELPRHELKRPLAHATQFLFEHGHECVAVFIVLSGFSLMWPVIRSADGQLRGGIWGYLKRRAWRILPPYYATLALTLLMVALVPIMRQPIGVRWDVAVPVFDTKVILSHIFMVHNFHLGRAYRIDPPMWSIATEWQIYFVFPVFLWIWRRFGISVTVAAGFLTGYAVHMSSVSLAFLTKSWYVGLFTLGMLAAVLTHPNARRWEQRGDRNLGLFLIGVILATMVGPPMMHSDSFVGVTAAALIAYCVRIVLRGDAPEDRPRLLRLLESAPAVAVGGFSYSLYLIHFPLLSLSHAALRGLGLGPNVRLFILVLVVSPLCVGAAWLFSQVFERPFLSNSSPGATILPNLLRRVNWLQTRESRS